MNSVGSPPKRDDLSLEQPMHPQILQDVPDQSQSTYRFKRKSQLHPHESERNKKAWTYSKNGSVPSQTGFSAGVREQDTTSHKQTCTVRTEPFLSCCVSFIPNGCWRKKLELCSIFISEPEIRERDKDPSSLLFQAGFQNRFALSNGALLATFKNNVSPRFSLRAQSQVERGLPQSTSPYCGNGQRMRAGHS